MNIGLFNHGWEKGLDKEWFYELDEVTVVGKSPVS